MFQTTNQLIIEASLMHPISSLKKGKNNSSTKHHFLKNDPHSFDG